MQRINDLCKGPRGAQLRVESARMLVARCKYFARAYDAVTHIEIQKAWLAEA